MTISSSLLLAVLLLGPPATVSSLSAPGGLPTEIPIALTRVAEPDRKLSPALRGLADSGRPVSFMVDLREQLDFARIAVPLERAPRAERRAWVSQALKTIAARGQRRLHPLLAALKRKGDVESWTGVAIVNRLLVKGRVAAIFALARDPEVASLGEEIESEGALEDRPELPDGGAPPAWPLDAMGVRQAWDAGIDGTGVTVGLIDSGASDGHEQLRGNFRGGPRSWFDPLHGSTQPSDVQLGHGTAVLSCAVGEGRGKVRCGVAPGAKWVAAVGLNEGRYNNLLLTRAADWMLGTGQPDVLIAPWRVPGDRCDRSLTPILDAWSAAGIVVVFAAGNGGPAPATDVPPANCGGIISGSGVALSVGAVDSTLQIDPISSRGPNSCGQALFPQLVAPGARILAALPAGSSLYREVSGTSFAAGYVAGVAALLLQGCPRARAAQIEQALREGAIDLGPPGPDPTYGYGLVHAGRALEALKKQPECR